MESNIERIKNDIKNITQITATPESGCTRFSYSDEDEKTREYLMDMMRDLNLSIEIDGVGNIRAKYITDTNKDNASIMIGSHIDTVANGGKFDGLTGVVSALEVIRVLKENDIKLKNPIELIIFAEEEGSNFGITMVGSKALIGKYGINDLKNIYNDKGISSYEIMKGFNLDVDKIEDQVITSNEVKAMIELHVEQGGILDSKGIPVGIVEKIAGMNTFKVNIKGVSNHAGSTPMNLRNDPMVGAAEIICCLKDVAKENALPNTVATVGKIHCEPNVANVIPREVEFYVDTRDVEKEGIEIVSERLKEKVKEVEEKYGLIIKVDLVGASDPVNLDGDVIEAIKKTAIDSDYKFIMMNSGAVHDAVMLTGITKVGMIFVPSINGKSHCMDEMTKMEDIKLGSDLLLGTVIQLGGENKI